MVMAAVGAAMPMAAATAGNLRDPHASKRQSRVRATGLVVGVRSCRCAERTE